jgi:hypothetical protein
LSILDVCPRNSTQAYKAMCPDSQLGYDSLGGIRAIQDDRMSHDMGCCGCSSSKAMYVQSQLYQLCLARHHILVKKSIVTVAISSSGDTQSARMVFSRRHQTCGYDTCVGRNVIMFRQRNKAGGVTYSKGNINPQSLLMSCLSRCQLYRIGYLFEIWNRV